MHTIVADLPEVDPEPDSIHLLSGHREDDEDVDLRESGEDSTETDVEESDLQSSSSEGEILPRGYVDPEDVPSQPATISFYFKANEEARVYRKVTRVMGQSSVSFFEKNTGNLKKCSHHR